LRRILEELAADGATVVISSHILSELSGMCTSVGIMHLGKLLQYGALDDVLDSLQAEQVQIELEVVGDSGCAAEILESRADTMKVRGTGSKLSFVFQGDAAARADLLKTLLERGVQVTAFTPRESGIESLLMRLIGAAEE
jgi:ABC-2 type transport system ATP-binding protein